MLLLRLYIDCETHVYAGTGKKVCVVGGGWVCKPILVFSFGPNQAFGLGLGLGPSRTILKINFATLCLRLKQFVKV